MTLGSFGIASVDKYINAKKDSNDTTSKNNDVYDEDEVIN
jgi:hypothetical protein